MAPSMQALLLLGLVAQGLARRDIPAPAPSSCYPGVVAAFAPPLHFGTQWCRPGGAEGSRAACRSSPVTLMARGKASAVGKRAGRRQEGSRSVWSMFGGDNNKGKKASKASSDSWWPPRLFGMGQEDEAKKRGRKKKEEQEKKKKSFWPSFGDFNEMWKGQISLQRRIKTLEKEVARDYKRGDRARAAQYRYEVLQTLEEVNKLKQQQEEIRKLDVKDARLLNKNKDIFDKDGNVVKPEDLDSLLQKERSLLQAMVLDEQQWARIGSACVGSAVGLAVFPNHDFFGVLAAAAFMTFLTTQSGFIGDAARMSGFAVVSGVKAAHKLEQRFEVLSRVGDFMREAIEASVPFRLPWSEAPTWRNAYRGEGFLHPDVRPAPPMKDFQYVEYLREVKRWVDAEERAVLAALKKKEDARIQDELDREAMKQQVQKLFDGVWSAASGLVTAASEAKKTAVDREAYKAQEEALKHFDNSLPAQGTDPADADGEEVDEYFELYDSYDEATYGGGDARVLQQQEGGSVKEEGVSREERQPSQVP